ncbi:hypothetical protein MKZ38_009748 [Zalerion maritima]|uniref:GTP binding protein n=1 Tax=Zalerion maritima TaxID=339359 RepID=A0AAD5RTX9_9PEZI|nr:hypothetical protein MKZ38_009748 [Zalerion maritima]
MTPLDIEAMFQGQGQAEIMDPDILMEQRSQQLQSVLMAAQHLWFAGDPGIDEVAQKLGDGSRDASWRLPLGASGILKFFLGIIAVDGLRTPLKTHTLRLIGNSCADTDFNRDIVIASGQLPSIIRLVNDDGSVLGFVIPVLYNILVDYQPAQDAAFSAGLALRLVDLIAGPRVSQCGAVVNLVAQILMFFAGRDPSPETLNPMTPFILMNYPISLIQGDKQEGFVTLTATALAFLTNEIVQRHFLGLLNTMNGPVTYILHVYQAAVMTWAPQADTDPDVAQQWHSMKTAFLNVLADMSSLDEFATLAQTQPDIPHMLINFLSSGYPDLQCMACLVLGNLARNDETSVLYVQTHSLQIHAAGILTNPQNARNTMLLHASLGFLKNLAIPAANKALLGPSLIGTPSQPSFSVATPTTSSNTPTPTAHVPPPPLPNLWALDTLPQVQFASVSLTRSLCAGCPPNIKLLLHPLSTDPSSPASQRSKLSVLLDLFSRSDAEPTRVECARLVLAVCRVLHSTPIVSPFWPTPEDVEGLQVRAAKKSDHISKTLPPAPGGSDAFIPPPSFPSSSSSSSSENPASATAPKSSSSPPSFPTPPGLPLGSNGRGANLETHPSARRSHFYAWHPELPRALSLIVNQRKWPSLRSECWFVFALMSRSAEGAAVVMSVLMDLEGTHAIGEALTGERDDDVRAVFGEDGLGSLSPGGGPRDAETEAERHSPAVSGDGGSNTLTPGNPAGMDVGTPISNAGSSSEAGTGGWLAEQEAHLRSLGLSPQGAGGVGGGVGAGGRMELEPQQIDPEKKQHMVRVDRENAIVLVTELMRNCPDMPPMRRNGFHMLLRKAGEAVEAGRRG